MNLKLMPEETKKETEYGPREQFEESQPEQQLTAWKIRERVQDKKHLIFVIYYLFIDV